VFNLRDYDDHWHVRVHRNNVTGAHEQIVRLPKVPVNGSYFGTCTCGADQMNGVPCEHMAAIALSSIIRPQITLMNIMPVWWKRSQLRVQFPLDVYADAKLTIKTIKEGRIPDHRLRLCPDWTAANKSGRPKKGERHKSGLEKATAKANGAKNATAKKRRRCLVCGSGRRWRWTTMAVDGEGTRELAADDDGQGTRPGGEQNGIRH
jgi:hypothetical protein